MSFNTPTELKTDLKNIGQSFTDTDLQDYLDQANRRVKMSVGRTAKDSIVIYNTDKSEYQLSFELVDSVDKVEHFSIIDVEEKSDYSVDLETGKITINFVDDLHKRDVVKVYYVPVALKDLELKYAKKFIREDSYVSTGSDKEKSVLEDLNNEIMSLENDLNSRMVSSSSERFMRHRPTKRW